MATLTWLPWKCISCSNQSKGCRQSSHFERAQSPTKFSFAGNFSMVCQRLWMLGFKNLWKWKWRLPWPSDRAKTTQGKGKQKSLGRATKILSAGLGWKRLPMPLPQCSHRCCAYISLQWFSALCLLTSPPLRGRHCLSLSPRPPFPLPCCPVNCARNWRPWPGINY